MAVTPIHRLPFLLEGQEKAADTVNHALTMVDSLTNKATENSNSGGNNPPDLPDDGEMWFVSGTPTAGTAWEGHANRIALWTDTWGWIFLIPKKGWRVYEKNSNKYRVFDGTTWNVV